MGNNIYWMTTITYAIVLFLILANDIRMKKNVFGMEKEYRLLAGWMIAFFLIDAFWGLCDGGIIKGDSPLFVASTMFYLATGLTTFFSLCYVLEYLGDTIKYKKLYLALDVAIILFEYSLVIINLFTPIVFRVVDGAYVTGPYRFYAFISQYVVYLGIGIVTFIAAIREKHSLKSRYFAVFMFAFFPIVAGILQALFPDGPFCSMGYFLGAVLIHIFIVAKDREEAVKNNVLRTIAETYHSMHLLDLVRDTSEPYIEPEILSKIFGDEKSAKVLAYKAFDGTVSDEYKNIIFEFTDLTTLPERMKDKNSISCEFIGKNYGWTRVSFVAIEREGEELTKVMLITQVIDTEKKQQIDLLFKSYNDELTGLFNRRAYENDIKEMASRELEDSFVFVSMDVNGLKKVNDTLGHAAGDELLCGAAKCMIQCFSPYGKIFRTGGDEFCAMIYANPDQLETLKTDFERVQSEWSGEFIDNLAISSGYVAKGDEGMTDIHDIYLLADKRMYAAKSDYYKLKGVDRRNSVRKLF